MNQRWLRKDWFLTIVLIAGIVAAYLPVWHAGFIWDDEAHLTANPCIVGPLGLKEVWTTSAANYFPLVLTNLWVQHAIWGLNPLPYHLVNVAFHAASALLLWRLLRRLRVRGAWLGAALWALHPVQVESVAWISEMKNTQSGLLYLLAAWFFLRWVGTADSAGRKGGEGSYALALACALLAILSKPSTVMLPAALGLAWWWMDGTWRWRHLLRLAPFFLFAGAAAGWTIWEQKFHSMALGPEWNQTGGERLVLAGRAVWFYLGKLLWPHPLAFIYPRPPIEAARLAAWVPGLAAIAVFLGLGWRSRRRLCPAFFAYAYFLALLFPVLGFFTIYFFRYSFVADHFQYLASLGPLALAAAGLAMAAEKLERRVPPLAPLLGAGLLAALGALTWRQARTYASIETLWRATIAHNAGCWLAPYNLGTAYCQAGRFDEGVGLLQRAIAIKPDYAEAHNNLGNIFLQQGRVAAAAAQFEAALVSQPGNADVHYDLGLALAQENRWPEAIGHYRKALAIQPGDPDTHYYLGVALFHEGRVDEAIAEYRAALAIRPGDADALSRLREAGGR